jgi:beta-mannosidase
MELGGTWRAMEANDELRRLLPDTHLDDSAWPEIQVPGSWQATPAFAGSNGPILYRRRFEQVSDHPPGRVWLTFDGMFYQADVWLDGSYLGDTEGYFAPQSFEVTDHIGARDQHLLAVELACSPEVDPTRRSNLTGVFQGGDGIDPAWNPGGIWAGVRLHRCGSVRLDTLRVLCREASDERATIELEAGLDAAAAGSVEVTTTVTLLTSGPAAPAAVTTSTPTLATGDNRVRWRVTIERPALWWPRAIGDQPLYAVEVVVRVDGETSDARTVKTGLRRVRMQRWVTTINGERVFLKGANLGPSRRALSDVTAEDVSADLDLACDAGLDLLRVHSHVATPDLYDQADRIGMLLWQDLPLQGTYGQVRREAARQARQAVDLLGHHPSIVLWCGHTDATEPAPSGRESPATTAGIARRAARQAVPDLPGLRLDRSVRRTLERADGSRPVIGHSGVLPHPGGATDTHLYPGWYDGDINLPAVLARWPVLARFVSEFGAQAVPASADFMEPWRWPHLDWERLESRDGLERALLQRWAPTGRYLTFAGWRDATQAHQAEVIRRCVETLRRLKYRPSGGFCQYLLADAQPAITASVLDHERTPKAGFAALKAACAPVIVVADHPAAVYEPGEPVVAAVHIVSDLRVPIEEIVATARLSWPGGARSWRYTGRVGADTCARIGKIATTLPRDCTPGELCLELSLTWPDPALLEGVGTATNRYLSTVSIARPVPAGRRSRGRAA